MGLFHPLVLWALVVLGWSLPDEVSVVPSSLPAWFVYLWLPFLLVFLCNITGDYEGALKALVEPPLTIASYLWSLTRPVARRNFRYGVAAVCVPVSWLVGFYVKHVLLPLLAWFLEQLLALFRKEWPNVDFRPSGLLGVREALSALVRDLPQGRLRVQVVLPRLLVRLRILQLACQLVRALLSHQSHTTTGRSSSSPASAAGGQPTRSPPPPMPGLLPMTPPGSPAAVAGPRPPFQAPAPPSDAPSSAPATSASTGSGSGNASAANAAVHEPLSWLGGRPNRVLTTEPDWSRAHKGPLVSSLSQAKAAASAKPAVVPTSSRSLAPFAGPQSQRLRRRERLLTVVTVDASTQTDDDGKQFLSAGHPEARSSSLSSAKEGKTVHVDAVQPQADKAVSEPVMTETQILLLVEVTASAWFSTLDRADRRIVIERISAGKDYDEVQRRAEAKLPRQRSSRKAPQTESKHEKSPAPVPEPTTTPAKEVVAPKSILKAPWFKVPVLHDREAFLRRPAAGKDSTAHRDVARVKLSRRKAEQAPKLIIDGQLPKATNAEQPPQQTIVKSSIPADFAKAPWFQILTEFEQKQLCLDAAAGKIDDFSTARKVAEGNLSTCIAWKYGLTAPAPGDVSLAHHSSCRSLPAVHSECFWFTQLCTSDKFMVLAAFWNGEDLLPFARSSIERQREQMAAYIHHGVSPLRAPSVFKFPTLATPTIVVTESDDFSIPSSPADSPPSRPTSSTKTKGKTVFKASSKTKSKTKLRLRQKGYPKASPKSVSGSRVEQKPEVQELPQVEPPSEVQELPQVEPPSEVQKLPQVQPTPEVQEQPQVNPTPEVQEAPQVEPVSGIDAEPQVEPISGSDAEPQVGQTSGSPVEPHGEQNPDNQAGQAEPQGERTSDIHTAPDAEPTSVCDKPMPRVDEQVPQASEPEPQLDHPMSDEPEPEPEPQPQPQFDQPMSDEPEPQFDQPMSDGPEPQFDQPMSDDSEPQANEPEPDIDQPMFDEPEQHANEPEPQSDKATPDLDQPMSDVPDSRLTEPEPQTNEPGLQSDETVPQFDHPMSQSDEPEPQFDELMTGYGPIEPFPEYTDLFEPLPEYADLFEPISADDLMQDTEEAPQPAPQPTSAPAPQVPAQPSSALVSAPTSIAVSQPQQTPTGLFSSQPVPEPETKATPARRPESVEDTVSGAETQRKKKRIASPTSTPAATKPALTTTPAVAPSSKSAAAKPALTTTPAAASTPFSIFGMVVSGPKGTPSTVVVKPSPKGKEPAGSAPQPATPFHLSLTGPSDTPSEMCVNPSPEGEEPAGSAPQPSTPFGFSFGSNSTAAFGTSSILPVSTPTMGPVASRHRSRARPVARRLPRPELNPQYNQLQDMSVANAEAWANKWIEESWVDLHAVERKVDNAFNRDIYEDPAIRQLLTKVDIRLEHIKAWIAGAGKDGFNRAQAREVWFDAPQREILVSVESHTPDTLLCFLNTTCVYKMWPTPNDALALRILGNFKHLLEVVECPFEIRTVERTVTWIGAWLLPAPTPPSTPPPEEESEDDSSWLDRALLGLED
ncbi:hypothetical protein AMS68_007813 [Peltaster fructicola]|uniref:Uncharacterized protein n=1 Tax=Peltaster fructicola TaxID=286661 RepID=A0A6H0Y5P6_9PEZI|nr:hypothetical protein AMS68_007813 [Peltaster fructicola]